MKIYRLCMIKSNLKSTQKLNLHRYCSRIVKKDMVSEMTSDAADEFSERFAASGRRQDNSALCMSTQTFVHKCIHTIKRSHLRHKFWGHIYVGTIMFRLLTKWALAFVCFSFSFFHIFRFGHVTGNKN